jgi:hypothetical protein
MKEDYYLAIVPPLHVNDIWFKVLPHLMKGKEYWEDFYTIEQIKDALVLGRQQLWVMVDRPGKILLFACLTQIDEFPNKRVLRILYLGGSDLHRGMIKEMAKIEKWALEKGATMVDFLGRPEWAGLMKARKYEVPGYVFRKELTP